MKNLIVYDCEIEKAIPAKNEQPLPGIEYCKGWRDFEGMGISVITAIDVGKKESRVFLADNFGEFKALAENPNNILCGFNNRKFDDFLVGTIGVTIEPERSYDILREIWIASGLDPDTFTFSTHGGFSLEKVCVANFGVGKSGSGAFAPILWQQGRRGEVIDYCLRDTTLTYNLLQIIPVSGIKCPKTFRFLNIKSPNR